MYMRDARGETADARLVSEGTNAYPIPIMRQRTRNRLFPAGPARTNAYIGSCICCKATYLLRLRKGGFRVELHLVPLHWVYPAFIVLILGVLIKRRDTTLVCVVGILPRAHRDRQPERLGQRHIQQFHLCDAAAARHDLHHFHHRGDEPHPHSNGH